MPEPKVVSSDLAGYKVDEAAVTAAKRKVAERVAPIGYTSLKNALSDDEIRERLMLEFTSEPIDNYLTEMIVDGIHLNPKECLDIDLTEYIGLDMLYRWLNNEDDAVNVTGKAGKGKSNVMLWLMKRWCAISGKPVRLDNVVFHMPLFNLLLKGFKVKRVDADRVKLVNYALERGDAIALDEASDYTVAGQFSATMIMQTQDMEARMRALQVCRLASGTRRILHQSYYDIWAIERNPNTRVCTGVVYAAETNDPGSPVHYLGHVKVPYVDLKLFKAYNEPKMESIHGYARAAGSNVVAKVVRHFAEELLENKEYQALPLKPPISRINWIQSHDKYALFQTIQSFRDLEALSRPKIKLKKQVDVE